MQRQWATRFTLRTMAFVLVASIAPTLAVPGVASAAGPSVELPKTKSVVVTKQTSDPRPSDAASNAALSGDQRAGADVDGAGTSKATTLSPSSTWDVSEQSGDFSVSYPLRVPPAPGGLEPKLALSYRSSAVDGHTSSTNNQPSWVGEGWDLAPGFVERTYGGCGEDTEGDVKPPQVGDLCWRSDNAIAAFDGGGGMLIRDDSTGVWRAKNDNGARIERLSGAANGDEGKTDQDRGEHWRITTVDGTQYWFGSQQDSQSTWTVPVFGDDDREPCHGGTFESSQCKQAWRWNLDKVVDPNGNVIRYHYRPETNSYGMNLKDAAASYTRGGTLWKVEYGLNERVDSPASGQVEFGVEDRCVPGSRCTSDQVNWPNWPDTPLDTRCEAATCPKQYSPSFWSTKRLSTITTRVRDGSAFKDVDRWTLDQIYPNPNSGERAALWLKGIKHTGLVGGSLDLPSVKFEGAAFPNRVYEPTGDGIGPLNRYRLTGILSETGGITSITYASQCRNDLKPANAENNTMWCFPATWTKKNLAQRTDYFHKYVVATVIQSDRLHIDGIPTSTSPEQVTSYEYLDGAAWHWDQSEFTKETKKTWNEFRGFGRVRVRVGKEGDPAGPPTMTEQLFHRGMDGDRLNPDGGTKSVELTDSEGTKRTDHDWLAGVGYESRTFEGAKPSTDPDPRLLGKTITDAWWRGPTATRGPYKAYQVRPAGQRRFTAMNSGGWRQTKTETTYDDDGFPKDLNDLGDVATPADDRCTRTGYARNRDAWILDKPSTVEVVSVGCAATARFPANAVSNTRTSYDGKEPGVAPTRGNPTKVEIAKEWAVADAPTWITASTAEHDKHGRVTKATDQAGQPTTTKFTPETGGPVTGLEATGPPTPAIPGGLVTRTTLDPGLGQVLKVTDANGRTTETAYDPLGRKVEVWLANRPRATNKTGNYQFSYRVRDNAPSVVTTSAIGPNGNYTTSKTLLDGMLRPRQVQAPAVGGGRVLTDTRYDSHGRVWKSTQPYFNNAAVDDELWVAADAEVPGLTRAKFDGVGRVIASVYQAGAVDKSVTTTAYDGDRTHVTPPSGGGPTTTITDARGRITELRQYVGTAPTGAYDATTYRYNQTGTLSEVVAPGGATWRFAYDLRGNKIRSEDPDAGVSTVSYDNAGRMTSTKDGRGAVVAYEYDSLSRRTTSRKDGPNGTKLVEWKYDTALGGKGQLASSTRFVDNQAYTTSVGSYNELYRPYDSTVTIPATQGLLAGTYTWFGTYGQDGASLSNETYPAAGGLGMETVNYVQDDAGRLQSSSGGYDGETVELVTQTNYTRYGEVERLQLGEGTKRAWLSHYYDSNTRKIERSVVDAETPTPMQSDVRYTYDDAGFTTSIAEAAPGQVDTQCFRHDHLGRMTEAWTPKGACATNPSVPELGGAAPYWHLFSYDKSGNRKEEIRRSAAGDAKTTYGYPDPGQPQPHTLRSVTRSGRSDTYGYNAGGYTTSRTRAGVGESLTWDQEGHLESMTGPAGTTSFIYGPDGGRLLRKDPTGTTLYLGNQEVRLAASGGNPVATRYYAYGGKVIALRKGAKLTWMLGDQSATQLTIDSDTMEVSRRRQFPFGSPRGAQVAWPDEGGFAGGTLDPSTGLTHLGAREYDTDTGRFISADPIMDLTDPQQLNGYAYANNNPSTFADPNGLRSCGIDGADCGLQRATENTCGGPMCGGGYQKPDPGAPPPMSIQGVGPQGMDEARGRAHDEGVKAKRKGFRTTYVFIDILVPVRNGSANIGAEYDLVPGIIIGLTFTRPPDCSDPVNDATPQHPVARADPLTREQRRAYDKAYPAPPPTPAPMTAGQFLAAITGADTIVDCIMNPSWGGCLKAAAPFAAGLIGRAAAAGGRLVFGAMKAACSFAGETQVLMADGSTKPISKVEVDDQVLAADPVTGERGPRTVTAVLVHQDTMLDLVTKDGATVTTTEDHPFWNESDKAWERADQLDRGDAVLGATGARVGVIGLMPRTARIGTAYNLTVAGLHTYHVRVGNTPILVHNDCGTAIVRVDTAEGHAQISVQSPNGNTTSNLVVGGGWGGQGGSAGAVGYPSVVARATEMRGPAVKTHTFQLPDADAARAFQQNSRDNWLLNGPYDLSTRNCMTHCVDVLRAGGFQIPGGPAGTQQLAQYFGYGS